LGERQSFSFTAREEAHYPMMTKEESPSVSVSDLLGPLLEKREKWGHPAW
jgi:hypothetical protein